MPAQKKAMKKQRTKNEIEVCRQQNKKGKDTGFSLRVGQPQKSVRPMLQKAAQTRSPPSQLKIRFSGFRSRLVKRETTIVREQPLLQRPQPVARVGNEAKRQEYASASSGMPLVTFREGAYG